MMQPLLVTLAKSLRVKNWYACFCLSLAERGSSSLMFFTSAQSNNMIYLINYVRIIFLTYTINLLANFDYLRYSRDAQNI